MRADLFAIYMRATGPSVCTVARRRVHTIFTQLVHNVLLAPAFHTSGDTRRKKLLGTSRYEQMARMHEEQHDTQRFDAAGPGPAVHSCSLRCLSGY